MAEHDDRPLADDALVAPHMFLGTGGFLVALTVLYWFTAYEETGTTLLAGTALLAVWIGFYLWLRWKARSVTPAGTEQPVGSTRSGEPTAPDGHAAPPSMWPFVIGLGMAVLLSGMPLGYWIVLPGLLVTVLGTLGFVAESR